MFQNLNKQYGYITQQLFDTHIHRHKSPSTNSELAVLLEQKLISANRPQLLTADYQTNGRGQYRRTWQSPNGNLFLSLYYPFGKNSFPFYQPLSGLLSLVIAYQIIQLPIIQSINNDCQKKNLPKIGIKWANDIGIYPNNLNECHKQLLSLQKLAGILIEPIMVHSQQTKGLMIGVGLNILHAPKIILSDDKSYPTYQATSLWQLLYENNFNIKSTLPTAHELYQPICECIIQAIFYYNQLQTCTHLITQFQHQFNQIHLFHHQKVVMSQAQQKINYIGYVLGINKQGALQLRADDGTVMDFYTGTIRPINK